MTTGTPVGTESLSGIKAFGFEFGGSFCFDSLDLTYQPARYNFKTEDDSIAGYITTTGEFKNKKVRYTSKSEECYESIAETQNGFNILTKGSIYIYARIKTDSRFLCNFHRMVWHLQNQNCADFPLTSTAIRAKIQKVFQTSVAPKNNGYLSFDGTIDSSYDNDLQSFTKLECGKSYIIVLKPAVGSLVIDEFSFTDGGNSVGGLVTLDCKPEPTPTPIKPTPTPIDPTPTPEQVSTDCNCGDENTTNVTIVHQWYRQIVISLLDFL